MSGPWRKILSAIKSFRKICKLLEERRPLSFSVKYDAREIVWEIRNAKTGSVEYLRLPWDDIAVIGFETNSSGPWLDDWFLVFIDKREREYRVTLADAWPGALDLYNHVLARPGVTLGEKGTLVNRADDASVIVWPPGRAGAELPR